MLSSPVNEVERLLEFIHGTCFDDMPEAVIAHARRCLVDLCGVAAGGRATTLSQIICDHATEQFAAGSRGARMLFDGRRVSLAGAALAGGMTIDSLDAHDGHALTKGHVGVTVLPTLLALADAGYIRNGREFLAALVVGYEVATRAGIALHATACDYHTSGAWNALGAAALTARALGMDAATTREALGIAEFHGPRSQMMRCIDYPTMVKDGSGWGAMAGVSAALLARSGFTGAPALTVESEAVSAIWRDLGQRWLILDQYFKPYPICRWAQPAVEAALALKRAHTVDVSSLRKVTVTTFHQACRLATRHPDSTEQAQYSLPFSVAIALTCGTLGAREVGPEGLANELALRISANMQLRECEAFSRRFPAERWADVEFELDDGRLLRSEPHTARGDPGCALSEAEIADKFRDLAIPVVGVVRADAINAAIIKLAAGPQALDQLCELLLSPTLGVRQTA